MTDSEAKEDVALVLSWEDLGDAASLRRNTTGFDKVKELAVKASPDAPLKLNAFLYAFLCPAKNFDLFLTEDTGTIREGVSEIAEKMDLLSRFEREAKETVPEWLLSTYLALRNVVARRTARDERRILAALLFSGTSTAEEIAADLGISGNGVERVLRSLEPVLRHPDEHRVALRADTDNLAVVLQLLRSTLGVDPLAVLQRRIAATARGGA
jgi:hypothetical protein